MEGSIGRCEQPAGDQRSTCAAVCESKHAIGEGTRECRARSGRAAVLASRILRSILGAVRQPGPQLGHPDHLILNGDIVRCLRHLQAIQRQLMVFSGGLHMLSIPAASRAATHKL
jgi:hypothetical protein